MNGLGLLLSGIFATIAGVVQFPWYSSVPFQFSIKTSVRPTVLRFILSQHGERGLDNDGTYVWSIVLVKTAWSNDNYSDELTCGCAVRVIECVDGSSPS